eukprot:CAMPEP_0196761740 /NCGR_PEP_ID=MMETSP1095-20130614/1046_1 /TAXON_ID=96789 ORGANISM="Chromulina nebulosa, Strain UTEXLB2642" /NCGR_SAMPLE_ID=MMETSP1095 /ASSEMBLY_ACC=CAM_ASM_000446 /LENGTH=226 /DNA_ID=CAMNT_0042111667 /DNA_START=990 /DNA_END=1666 /DNA_ORIENTATION=-
MSYNYTTVGDLNTYLSTRSYISGYKSSELDVKILQLVGFLPSPVDYPHASRWANHIQAISGTKFTAGASTSAPTKVSDDKADDFDDLFGDDAEVPVKPASNEDDEDNEGLSTEEIQANKARKERMALAKKLKEENDLKSGKKAKVKEEEKSLVVLEVKPWEADTDLKALWEKIIEYKQEGLHWGASYKLEPVAYGIMKLVLTCTIVDKLVLLDDITENIEALEDYV